MSSAEAKAIWEELHRLAGRVDRLTWVGIAVLSATGFDFLRPLIGV